MALDFLIFELVLQLRKPDSWYSDDEFIIMKMSIMRYASRLAEYLLKNETALLFYQQNVSFVKNQIPRKINSTRSSQHTHLTLCELIVGIKWDDIKDGSMIFRWRLISITDNFVFQIFY